MLHFYDVAGVLVRRWVPAHRRLALEAWSGDGWTTYADVETVSRHGRRITDEEALTVLHRTRAAKGSLTPLQDHEAATALRARLRRA